MDVDQSCVISFSTLGRKERQIWDVDRTLALPCCDFGRDGSDIGAYCELVDPGGGEDLFEVAQLLWRGEGKGR